MNSKDSPAPGPRSFRVTANLKFQKDRYLYADGVLSLQGVEFRPLDQSRKDAGVSVTFELSGNADEARLQGLKLERIRAVLCCTNNIGMSVEDYAIVPLPYTDNSGIHAFLGGGIELSFFRPVTVFRQTIFAR